VIIAVYFRKKKYYQLIKKVKEAKQKNKKESVDYRRLKRFDVISVSSGENLSLRLKEKVLLYCII
jgi:hypothetical protein